MPRPGLPMPHAPFDALAVFTLDDLWTVLRKFWLARPPTVILVTHDLHEAAFLAGRVLVMLACRGRIITERAVTATTRMGRPDERCAARPIRTRCRPRRASETDHVAELTRALSACRAFTRSARRRMRLAFRAIQL